MIFIIFLCLLSSCNKHTDQQEKYALSIFVNQINKCPDNTIPKEFIDFLLPFEENGVSIFFSPKLIRFDFDSLQQDLKGEEYKNSGLQSKQKKLRAFYESIKLDNSFCKPISGKNYTEKQYFDKILENNKDSVTILLLGNNIGYKFLEKNKLITFKELKNINQFRKEFTNIVTKKGKNKVILFYNLQIKSQATKGKISKEEIDKMLAIERDSLSKVSDTLEKSKEDLLIEIAYLKKQLREAKTEQSKDAISEQIIIRNYEIQSKNAEIASLKSRLNEVENELKREKEKNVALENKIRDLEQDLANANGTQKALIQKQLDELESQKRVYEEQQSKDKIAGEIRSHLQSGKLQTEDIRVEKSKIAIYTKKKGGEDEKVTFNIFESKRKALKSRRVMYKQSICQYYGAAYKLAKEHNIMLNEVLGEINQKRQIYAKLCQEAEEDFEGGTSNGSPESWIKTCQ